MEVMRFRAYPALLCVMIASAQTPPKAVDWQTTTNLPQVDLSGLTPAQKKTALTELRNRPCLCSCNMTLAECRIKDPKCSDSRGLAQIVVKAVHDGHDVQYAIEHSDLVARRTGAPNVLEKPVPLPIKGAPAKGPANARLTIVEFSDFECPYCTKAAAKIDTILQAYPKDAKLVYKQY